MIKFADGWLKHQFDGFVHRGAIIKFLPDDLDDPKQHNQPKFAVILNAICPEPEILYIFSTSQHSFYDTHGQFEQAIIRVPGGTYSFLPKDTVFPFRNVRGIAIEKLHAQYVAGTLTVCGKLGVDHVARMDEIISDGLFIDPRTRTRILPAHVTP